MVPACSSHSPPIYHHLRDRSRRRQERKLYCLAGERLPPTCLSGSDWRVFISSSSTFAVFQNMKPSPVKAPTTVQDSATIPSLPAQPFFFPSDRQFPLYAHCNSQRPVKRGSRHRSSITRKTPSRRNDLRVSSHFQFFSTLATLT